MMDFVNLCTTMIQSNFKRYFHSCLITTTNCQLNKSVRNCLLSEKGSLRKAINTTYPSNSKSLKNKDEQLKIDASSKGVEEEAASLKSPEKPVDSEDAVVTQTSPSSSSKAPTSPTKLRVSGVDKYERIPGICK